MAGYPRKGSLSPEMAVSPETGRPHGIVVVVHNTTKIERLNRNNTPTRSGAISDADSAPDRDATPERHWKITPQQFLEKRPEDTSKGNKGSSCINDRPERECGVLLGDVRYLRVIRDHYFLSSVCDDDRDPRALDPASVDLANPQDVISGGTGSGSPWIRRSPTRRFESVLTVDMMGRGLYISAAPCRISVCHIDAYNSLTFGPHTLDPVGLKSKPKLANLSARNCGRL